MRESTKELLKTMCGVVTVVGLFFLICLGMITCEQRAVARIKAARGSILYEAGQRATIKTTGEHTIVTGVYGCGNRWVYRCRVAFGRKDYPIGVITNPTQITKTYELVDFYGFELEAR